MDILFSFQLTTKVSIWSAIVRS